jgi:HAD superfamily hydrolase (TIGR01509 family)
MTHLTNISAVIFDMDGTLVDSEVFTESAVKMLCGELGINNADIDCSAFDGVSWENIGKAIIRHYPSLAGKQDIAGRLHHIYHRMLKNNPPSLIKKARETVIAAHTLMPTAIVSSSNRVSIEETIRRMEITAHINYYAGCEDYNKSKPAPDSYLKAAEILQTAVTECLVFEDSIVGIQAARRAGMQVVAVTHSSSHIARITRMADMAIRDFSELAEDFFQQVINRE